MTAWYENNPQHEKKFAFGQKQEQHKMRIRNNPKNMNHTAAAAIYGAPENATDCVRIRVKVSNRSNKK